MNAQLVHRYAFPVQDAIEALLGDAVGDCEGWRIRVEGDEVVVDVIGPASERATEAHGATSAVRQSDTQETPQRQPAGTEPAKTGTEEPKGGRNAQRAAILCGEGGFQAFLGVNTADEARDQILRRCGVESRRFLDHDERAAETWRRIEEIYGLWIDGFDAELEPIGAKP